MVRDYCGFKEEDITLETRVGEDLGIVGDDADELLSDFRDEYAVDFSGFVFEDYFPFEVSTEMYVYLAFHAENRPGLPAFRWLRMLRSSFYKRYYGELHYRTMTVGNLVRAARIGSMVSALNENEG